MTFGPRTKYHFTGFKLVRVGNCVVLKATANERLPSGADVEVALEFEGDEARADLYEQWFDYMVGCTEIIGDMPENAFEASRILTKGRS